MGVSVLISPLKVVFFPIRVLLKSELMLVPVFWFAIELSVSFHLPTPRQFFERTSTVYHKNEGFQAKT
jgi:hypothetical protein